jgi:hypothetical protein
MLCGGMISTALNETGAHIRMVDQGAHGLGQA